MNCFNKIPYKAVIVLFSKIIIKRLSRGQINIFLKVEKITKSFIKVNADLKYENRSTEQMKPNPLLFSILELMKIVGDNYLTSPVY